MRLPFLRPKPEAEPVRPAASKAERARKMAPDDNGIDVQTARTRARRRLVGALVLLVIGIVGFPLLFETTPRPLPLDTPFEVPRREGSTPALPPVARPAPARALPVTSLPADAGTEVADAPAAAPSAATTATAAAAVVPPSAASTSTARAAVAPPATLDGGASTPAAAAGRFVVQVGAYSDAATLREARAKVEKLGLKTYTQVIENDAGRRTRVRLGPYATRAEADAAAAKVKRSGLPANIITL